jgi:predicted metallopeptidase
VFDFTNAMESLVRHVTANCPELAHVQTDRILISYFQTRSPGAHGVYASVQPLRFEEGSRTKKRRGRTYAMPEIKHEGKEIMYIVYFALPRFANLSFEEKLTTVFHELYHIGPEFNGDIRRFTGKYYAHGKSRKRFNELVRKLADAYMTAPGAEEHIDFLRKSFDELRSEHGTVIGNRVRPPRPKLVSD